MSVSKDMFGFIAGVAVGAAGYYLATHPHYANELGTKVTNLIKTKLNEATASFNKEDDVSVTTNNNPVEPEEGVSDGSTLG